MNKINLGYVFKTREGKEMKDVSLTEDEKKLEERKDEIAKFYGEGSGGILSFARIAWPELFDEKKKTLKGLLLDILYMAEPKIKWEERKKRGELGDKIYETKSNFIDLMTDDIKFLKDLVKEYATSYLMVKQALDVLENPDKGMPKPTTVGGKKKKKPDKEAVDSIEE